MKSVALFLFSVAASFAQLISGGFKGGVPLTDAFDIARNPQINFFSTNHRYTIGPMLELHLPVVSVEFDALFKRLDFGSSANLVDVIVNSKTVANSWEFPLLLKFRLAPGLARPYISAGASFNHLSGISQAVASLFVPGNRTTTTTTSNPQELRNDNRVGFVIAGGIELRPPFIRISPEIRYTRWGSDTFRDVNALLRSRQDQAEFLVGITF